MSFNTLEREITNERFEITDLQYDQVYIFELKSISENGNESEWTEPMTFRTDKEDVGDIPQQPTNINIDVIGNEATITFVKGTNAFMTRVAKEWENTFIETPETEVIFSDLEYDKEYITAFQSVSEDGKLGEWTEAMTFRTEKETSLELPSNINAKVTGTHVKIIFTKGQNAYKTAISGDMIAWKQILMEILELIPLMP